MLTFNLGYAHTPLYSQWLPKHDGGGNKLPKLQQCCAVLANLLRSQEPYYMSMHASLLACSYLCVRIKQKAATIFPHTDLLC